MEKNLTDVMLDTGPWRRTTNMTQNTALVFTHSAKILSKYGRLTDVK